MMSHAPNTDYAAIGKIYREQRGGPWFPCIQDIPRKPLVHCWSTTCPFTYDPNDGTSRGQCAGLCEGG